MLLNVVVAFYVNLIRCSSSVWIQKAQNASPIAVKGFRLQMQLQSSDRLPKHWSWTRSIGNAVCNDSPKSLRPSKDHVYNRLCNNKDLARGSLQWVCNNRTLQKIGSRLKLWQIRFGWMLHARFRKIPQHSSNTMALEVVNDFYFLGDLWKSWPMLSKLHQKKVLDPTHACLVFG